MALSKISVAAVAALLAASSAAAHSKKKPAPTPERGDFFAQKARVCAEDAIFLKDTPRVQLTAEIMLAEPSAQTEELAACQRLCDPEIVKARLAIEEIWRA